MTEQELASYRERFSTVRLAMGGNSISAEEYRANDLTQATVATLVDHGAPRDYSVSRIGKRRQALLRRREQMLSNPDWRTD